MVPVLGAALGKTGSRFFCFLFFMIVNTNTMYFLLISQMSDIVYEQVGGEAQVL